MLCKTCGTLFEAKRHRPGDRFCSSRCRAKAWRRQREQEIMASLEEAAQAIHRARVAVSGEGEDLA
jgi:predicted nucleic acid-binding Zn ribbon protein